MDSTSNEEEVDSTDVLNSDYEVNSDDELTSEEIEAVDHESAAGNSTRGQSFWNDIKRVVICGGNSLPSGIDGKCVFVVKAKMRSILLNKIKDSRPWKHDSRTNWKNYETVRYRKCRGQLKCQNSNCVFIQQYGEENRLRFDKKNVSLYFENYKNKTFVPCVKKVL